MGNRSHLYRTDHPHIKPALLTRLGGMVGFDESKHTLLVGAYCVPIVWLSLFSTDSIATLYFHVDANDNWVPAEGPGELLLEGVEEVAIDGLISEIDLCLDRLGRNLPLIEKALNLSPDTLKDHGDNLRKAIERGAGRYVSADYEQMQAMTGEFNAAIRDVLNYLDGTPNDDIMKSCALLGDFHLDRPILPPSLFHQLEWKDEDLINLDRLIGSGWITDAPWEQGK